MMPFLSCARSFKYLDKVTQYHCRQVFLPYNLNLQIECDIHTPQPAETLNHQLVKKYQKTNTEVGEMMHHKLGNTELLLCSTQMMFSFFNSENTFATLAKRTCHNFELPNARHDPLKVSGPIHEVLGFGGRRWGWGRARFVLSSNLTSQDRSPIVYIKYKKVGNEFLKSCFTYFLHLPKHLGEQKIQYLCLLIQTNSCEKKKEKPAKKR